MTHQSSLNQSEISIQVTGYVSTNPRPVFEISSICSDAVTERLRPNIMVPRGKLILPNFCLNRDKLFPMHSHQTGNSGGSQVGPDVAGPVVRHKQAALNAQTIQITNNLLQNWVVTSLTQRDNGVPMSTKKKALYHRTLTIQEHLLGLLVLTVGPLVLFLLHD